MHPKEWGYIKTAKVSSETDRLMSVEGKYSFAPPSVVKIEKGKEISGRALKQEAERRFQKIKNKHTKIKTSGQYTTRVLFSERLDSLLQDIL